jgi:phosphoenolpyruvate synthase/pyruvate phosphate dikinase
MSKKWVYLFSELAAVEDTTGKKIGHPGEPLPVSCRSDARFSMPGMMDTILDIGLDATGDAELGPGDWEHVTCRLEDIVRAYAGRDFPDQPVQQLRMAIEAVLESWTGERAIDYRNAAGIGHDLGTAVNIVTMVFGDMGATSATGEAAQRVQPGQVDFFLRPAIMVRPETREMRVGDRGLEEGEPISIDGTLGEIYLGELPTVVPDMSDPHLTRLLAWADQIRAPGVRANADYPRDAERARAYGAEVQERHRADRAPAAAAQRREGPARGDDPARRERRGARARGSGPTGHEGAVRRGRVHVRHHDRAAARRGPRGAAPAERRRPSGS